MKEDLVAEFNQKGLKGGFAVIILPNEQGEWGWVEGDEIILAHPKGSSYEYLGRDKGQWTTKMESLSVKGTKNEDGIVYHLEPFYVDCLEKGIYEVILVDANGLEKCRAIMDIKGVKKSPLGSTGFKLAQEEQNTSSNEAQETLTKILDLTRQAKDAENKALEDLNKVKEALFSVKNSLQKEQSSQAQDLLANIPELLGKVQDTKGKVNQLLATAQGLLTNSSLAKDAIKAPEATKAINDVQTSLVNIEREISQSLSFQERLSTSITELEMRLANRAAEAERVKQEAALRTQKEAEEAEKARLAAEAERVKQEAALRTQKEAEEAEKARLAAEAEATKEVSSSPQKKSKTGVIIGCLVAALLLAIAAVFLLKPSAPTKTAQNQTEEAAKAEAERKATEEAAKAEAERQNARGRVAAFFAGQNPTPDAAMQLASELASDTPEQQDAIYRLYYYAAQKNHPQGMLKRAQCLDPSKPTWGTIKKDAPEAWYYYGQSSEGTESRSALKAWLEQSAKAGDAQSERWLKELK